MRPVARPALRERVPRDASTAITVRDVVHTHFSYPWHYHPEVELMLIVNGRGLRYVGDSIHEFDEGDLCLIGGDLPHCWHSTLVPDRPVRAVVIQFPADVFGSDFLLRDATRPLRGLLERAGRGLSVGESTRSQIAAEMWRLVDPATTDLEKLVRLLNMLAAMAVSPSVHELALSSGSRSTSSADATRAGKLLRYIHDHAFERISQRAASVLVGMSPGAFSRFFARHFGKPFVSYVAEVRVGHACRLLMENDMNVSEVAYHAGFNNLANFNRQFLRIKGVTPSAYRKMARRLA